MINKKRILQAILIIILSIIVIGLTGKSVNAESFASYRNSDLQTITDLYNNPNAYCLNYLWEFEAGSYLPVESGQLRGDLAYLVYERN